MLRGSCSSISRRALPVLNLSRAISMLAWKRDFPVVHQHKHTHTRMPESKYRRFPYRLVPPVCYVLLVAWTIGLLERLPRIFSPVPVHLASTTAATPPTHPPSGWWASQFMRPPNLRLTVKEQLGPPGTETRTLKRNDFVGVLKTIRLQVETNLWETFWVISRKTVHQKKANPSKKRLDGVLERLSNWSWLKADRKSLRYKLAPHESNGIYLGEAREKQLLATGLR